jgi:D-alanyl-D-alanine dipeptidase
VTATLKMYTPCRSNEGSQQRWEARNFVGKRHIQASYSSTTETVDVAFEKRRR